MFATARSKTHMVCLPCRNVHKAGLYRPVCEFCREPMLDLGKNFHAPKRTDDQQWKKIAVMLSESGTRFTGNLYGLSKRGTQPRTYSEAKQRRKEKRRQPYRLTHSYSRSDQLALLGTRPRI